MTEQEEEEEEEQQQQNSQHSMCLLANMKESKVIPTSIEIKIHYKEIVFLLICKYNLCKNVSSLF